MKARIVRYGFIGVVAVLIILCGMKFSNMYKDYQKLQFNQEQIDTQVSVLMSMLFSDLYYSDPIDLGETKEHADELSVLLQVTSYDEIPHFNDIANKLIEISKNVESRPAFSEQTIELFQSFIYNLGKPLSDDIDGRLRKAYLEMHRPILFNELVLSDKLFEHCAEIDEAARNRTELIVRSLAKRNGVTEKLKAENQMEWVRQMNACKAQAEEIVKFELIYD